MVVLGLLNITPGCGGTQPLPQHSRGRSRKIPASLIYIVSFRTVRAIQWDPVSKTTTIAVTIIINPLLSMFYSQLSYRYFSNKENSNKYFQCDFALIG